MQNTPKSAIDIRRYQRFMIGHSALVITIGLICGFMLAFNVLGKVMLWPFLSFDITIIGSEQAWRAAHIGPLLNGSLCIAVAAILPLFKASRMVIRWVSWGLIYTIWANTLFYLFAIGSNNRGLAYGSEKFGPANIFDLLAYLPATSAAIITLAVMVTIAYLTLRRDRDVN